MIKTYTDEELPQGSKEWLEVRRGYGTASEAASACEVSPWIPKSRLQLWELKNGELEIKTSFAMQIGNDYEDEAKAWFQDYSGKLFEACCIIDDETYDMPLMASLDGRQVFGGTEILEIKVPLNGGCSPLWAAMENEEELPLNYQLQMTQQMMLAGEDFCHFCVYDWKLKKGLARKFPLKLTLVAQIVDGWAEYFKGKPEAGPKDIVKRDDADWMRVSQEWKAMKAQADSATKELKELRAQMIKLAAGRSFQGNGVRVRKNNDTGAYTVGKIK